jgi:hypothetical protein
MNMVKVFLRTAILVILCLLNSLIVIPFLLCRVQSATGVGSGHIKVESLDLSAGVAKLIFVFDEETGSDDFHERSTSWLIMRQYGINLSIPIGRADPDWELVGTNNLTIWHWRLEKTFDLEYQTSELYPFIFPREVFTVNFYIATNISRWFSVSVDIPSFSASINQQYEDYNQSSCPYKPEGCPELKRINISVFHNSEYQTIIFMLYSIIFILIAIAIFLFKKRNVIEADFFTISSTLLVFVPVLFFAFRDIAPPYLTLFDGLCLVVTIIYGCLILGKLIYKGEPIAGSTDNITRKSDFYESF